MIRIGSPSHVVHLPLNHARGNQRSLMIEKGRKPDEKRGYFLPSSCGGVIGGRFCHANCSCWKANAWVGARRHYRGSYMQPLKSSLGFLFHMTSPPCTSCTCCQLLTNDCQTRLSAYGFILFLYVRLCL